MSVAGALYEQAFMYYDKNELGCDVWWPVRPKGKATIASPATHFGGVQSSETKPGSNSSSCK